MVPPPLRALSTVLLALGLAACTPTQAPAPEEQNVPLPAILAFRAQEVQSAGERAVLLTWQTRNATRVSIRDSVRGEVSGVDDQAEGALQLPPVEEATLFVLTATNARGVSERAVAQVMPPEEAVDITFLATPAQVRAGEPVVLAWAAPGAEDVSLVADGLVLDLKGQGAVGTLEVAPLHTTEYVLRADGREQSARVEVEPRLVSFTTSDEAALPGADVLLSWSTQGARRVELSEASAGPLFTADEESNPVAVLTGSHSFTLPPSANPEAVFTFTLRVLGAEGSVAQEQTLEVYVEGKPRITDVQAPIYARAGGTFPLSWKTLSATRVEVHAGGTVVLRIDDAPSARQGSTLLPTPEATTDYSLVAYAERGGEASERFQVEPVGGLQKPTLTVSPGTVVKGGDPVQMSWTAPSARHAAVRDQSGLILHSVSGGAAESQSVTLYPNADTTYTLVVDNGLGEVATATATLAVPHPTGFTADLTGPILEGVPLQLTPELGGAGTPIYGTFHDGLQQRDVSQGFIDIRNTGERLPFGPGDASKVASISPTGFSTYAFGRGYSGRVTVSLAGWMRLDVSTATLITNGSLPSTSAGEWFLAPYWESLKVGPQGGVYWQVVERDGEPVLVVQWDDMVYNSTSYTSSFSFEVQVHHNGTVHFEYGEMTVGTVPASTRGTVGIQRDSGTAVGYPYLPLPNSGLTFLSPRPAPFTWRASEGSFFGLLKRGGRYMPLTYRVEHLLRAGDLTFSEVLPFPEPAVTNGGEFIEVSNRTDRPVDLAGFTLTGADGNTLHTLHSSGGRTVVPAGGMLILGESSTLDGVEVDYTLGAPLLADSAGTLGLTQRSVSADTFSWEEVQPGVSVVRDGQRFIQASDTTPKTVPHPLACSPGADELFGTQAPFQRGTPGRASRCFPYALQSIPADYEDISADGTPLYTSSTISSVVTVDLDSMPVTVWGQERSAMHVTGYGWVSFADTKPSLSSFTSVLKPSSSSRPSAFAIFADSLTADTALAGANVYVKQVEEDPARGVDPHWVVQWSHVKSTTGDDFNFQLKLFKDGTVEYHYGLMESGSSTNYGDGHSATIWAEEPSGQTALVIGTQEAVITSGIAFRFTP